MPDYRGTVTEEEQAAVAAPEAEGGPATDLNFYIGELQQVLAEGRTEAVWDLLEGESERTEKRRFTLAAKQLGLVTTWKPAPAGAIRLVLSGADTAQPRRRTRQTQATAGG